MFGKQDCSLNTHVKYLGSGYFKNEWVGFAFEILDCSAF